MSRSLAILFALILIYGCTRYSSVADKQVSSTIEMRTDQQVVWYQSYDDCDHIQETVQSLIQQELTPADAVQIAFLNHPAIQSLFEELGIAQADLIEAGLLSNPSFSLEIRYPNHSNLKTNVEYLITSSFLDILLIPLRKKIASTEFEQVKLHVTNQILDLAFDVRSTFHELIAEKHKLSYIEAIVELLNIHREITSRQFNVGNINQLDLQLIQSKSFEAELEIIHTEAQIIRLHAKLNRLLGLSEEICLILPETSPPIDDFDFDLCQLESLALSTRLDLQEKRLEILRFSQLLGLKHPLAYTNFNIGVAGERDTDGTQVLGPGFTGEIPIFNYGQAARLRLFAQLRQAQNRFEALKINILYDVRESHQLMLTHIKEINNYRYNILPSYQKVTESSEQLYNIMGLGIDRLLDHKRQELMARKNYIDAIKNYWLARVNLDRALGGNLFQLFPYETYAEGPK